MFRHVAAITLILSHVGTPAQAMNLREAIDVVAKFQARRLQEPSKKFASPHNLDDVEAILKRDQINLFPAGVAIAKRGKGVRALALHGQIELAWGEAQQILARLMQGLEQRLRASATRMRGKKRTEQLALAKDLGRTAQAFELLSTEHFELGAKAAKQIIAKYPNSYLGYRVVADYYRLEKDWANFARMIKKIETTNAKSNGLNFLRGVAAAYRDKDMTAATTWLEAALKRDPQFVRAQAHLLMIQSSMQDIYTHYLRLEKLNPEHQVIDWAGRSIEQAYEAWKASQQ